MKILVGVDDTDNKESRGTGYKSRQLGKLIEEANLGYVECISRHQLFFDSRIPYTSQNSSACLLIEGNKIKEIIELSRLFLLKESAPGSDAGLAVSIEKNINSKIIEWGNRAKKEVLTQKEAYQIAEQENIYLEGLTGDKDGIIGSLAAIGLRKAGNDGRCIWLKGKEIRDLEGIISIHKLRKIINFDKIVDQSGKEIEESSIINVGDWLRPAIINNNITIIVEKSQNNSNYEYKVASKDYIKSISD